MRIAVLLITVLLIGCAHTTLDYSDDNLVLTTSLRDKHTVEIEYYADGQIKKIETSRMDATSDDVIKAVAGFIGGILALVGL